MAVINRTAAPGAAVAGARSAKATSADLLDMLRRHHGLTAPADEWAGGVLVHEVSPNGPMSDSRRADAIYCGFTAASGRCLIGYELKTSRADWRREINRAGQKADQWSDECHEWWIVVTDPAIVKDGELPRGWGLMSPPCGSDHRMTVHVRAERKTHHCPSWNAMRSIMSRLETLRAKTIKDQIWQIKLDAARQARADAESEYAKRHTPDAVEVHRRLTLIEEALGVRLDWGQNSAFVTVPVVDLAHIGAAAREYGTVTAGVEAITAQFGKSITTLRTQLEHLERHLAALDQCGSVPQPNAETTTTPPVSSPCADHHSDRNNSL